MTIFERMQDIHLETIFINFCAIPKQKIRVIKISLLLWIFIISEIINRSTENKFENKFIFNWHVRYIDIKSFVSCNRKYNDYVHGRC